MRCLLGWHKWGPWQIVPVLSRYMNRNWYAGHELERRCFRCGRVEHS